MALDVTQGLSGWSSDPPQAADCISYSSGSLSSEPGPADPDEHPVFRSGEPRPPPKCRRNLRRRGLAGTRRRAVVLADLTGPRRSHAGSPIARRGAGASWLEVSHANTAWPHLPGLALFLKACVAGPPFKESYR